jgi:fructokinase
MGDALVDVIIDSDGEISSVVGGAGLNTALTVGRLGVPVQMIAGISEDSLGTRIHRTLVDNGVRDGLNTRTPKPTTIALASLRDDGSASYRFMLDGTSIAAVTSEQALAVAHPESTALLVGGVSLALDPFASAAVDVVQAAPEHCLVMLDPNYRPAISGSSPIYANTIAAILPRADLVKVSVEDLEALLPDMTAWAAAEHLRATHGCTVVLTAGDGDLTIFGDGEVSLPVPRVKVADTVAAGDAFSGGFLGWWFLNEQGRGDAKSIDALERAARAGIVVAAKTCERIGADPPHRHDLPDDWAQ